MPDAEIISIVPYLPHEVITVECLSCSARHVACFPLRTEFPLECGACGKMRCIKALESFC